MHMQRVAVFIDHSNVYHNLVKTGWPEEVRQYNPVVLAERLAGGRQLVKTMFYCSPPPPTLQDTNPRSYEAQTRYLDTVKKLAGLELHYGNLIMQHDHKYHEKNLDTQMTTGMLMMAFRDEYDVAIILSNDGDFADGVRGIRELGKWVEIAYFDRSLSFNLEAASDIVRKLRPSYFIKLSAQPHETRLDS